MERITSFCELELASLYAHTLAWSSSSLPQPVAASLYWIPSKTQFYQSDQNQAKKKKTH